MTIEVLTTALVIITGFYAWVTYRIMKANERVVAAMYDQTESLTRPYVSVSILTIPNNVLFYLRIANAGRTGATNVRLTLDKDFYQYGQKEGTNLRTVAAFQEPISELSPGAELVFGLAQGFVVLGDDADPAVTPPVFSVTATYSYAGTTVSERTVIDLRPYRQSVEPPNAIVDELKQIREDELRKIREAIAKIGSKG